MILLIKGVPGKQGDGLGLLLLTWLNLNASINHMLGEVWNEITYPFPNFNSGTVEAWEWLTNFIPHIIKDIVVYPYLD